MFWVVQLGAAVSTFVLLYVFRKENLRIHVTDRTKVTDYFPTVLLLGTIGLLILASFLPKQSPIYGTKPAAIIGIICVAVLAIGLIREIIKSRNLDIVQQVAKEIDYFTLLLLAGLFVVIAGITEAGVVQAISEVFVRIGGSNVFLMYTMIVWASVIFSAFIDNIPYVATMLPVTAGIAQIMGVDPTLFFFGLLCGATLGGNLTPIGASANITGLGILRKEGHEVSAGDFMKISVPFTLSAVITGYLLIWFLWS